MILRGNVSRDPIPPDVRPAVYDAVAEVNRRRNGVAVTKEKTMEEKNLASQTHYNGTECLDAMKLSMSAAEYRGFLRGNAFKYLWRLGKKGAAADDAKKAETYCRWLADDLNDRPEA